MARRRPQTPSTSNPPSSQRSLVLHVEDYCMDFFPPIYRVVQALPSYPRVLISSKWEIAYSVGRSAVYGHGSGLYVPCQVDGLVYILGENGGVQAIAGAVRDSQGLFHILHPHYGTHGPELRFSRLGIPALPAPPLIYHGFRKSIRYALVNKHPGEGVTSLA